MNEAENPVKDNLFSFIKENEDIIQNLISEKNFSKVIENILTNCYDKSIQLESKEEALGVLATGILHYLLTSALISSQRKVEYQGVEIDIVIPDLKTLEKDPKKTLIICLPKSINKEDIQTKLKQIEKIQSEKQNIWLVLSEDLDLDYKKYIISKRESTFSHIIYDIGQFVNVSGKNKFKILRV